MCQFGLGRPSFIPSRQFRDLRSVSRHRRSLVAQRSRVRNQVQKVLDRSGVRIGAVLSDIFGANGRRVLDGLVSRLDPEVILASLSGHVRLKVDQLGDALSLELRETDRILLTDLLDEHDTLTRRVSEFDRYIDQALASHAEACRLLETIPGIDRTSACAILIEAGPDVAVFGAARRLAAWAGVCPGNNESTGKRRSGRGRRGNKTLRAVLVRPANPGYRPGTGSPWRLPPSGVERGGTASSADGTLGPPRRDSLIEGRLRGPGVPGIPDQREPSVQPGWPHSR